MCLLLINFQMQSKRAYQTYKEVKKYVDYSIEKLKENLITFKELFESAYKIDMKNGGETLQNKVENFYYESIFNSTSGFKDFSVSLHNLVNFIDSFYEDAENQG